MSDYPNYAVDAAEAERRRRFLASQTPPPPDLPVYSDTELGAAGNYQINAQPDRLPVYQEPSQSARPSRELLPDYQQPAQQAPVAAPKPLTVVRDAHGAPTDEVTGDGDWLAKREARYRALQDYKPKSHNSRLRSILIGAGRGYLRGGLLGAIFGGVSHGVKPELDEEEHRDYEMDRTGREISGEYARRKTASALADADVGRRARLANIENQTRATNRKTYEDERDAALKNLEQFPVLDPSNDIHAEAINNARRAGWVIDPASWKQGAPHIAFDVNSGNGVQYDPTTRAWKPMLGADGQPISTRPPAKPADIPKTFYNLDGLDEKVIHANAIRSVGGKDFGGGFELDASKVKLLQKDGEDYGTAVGRIKEMLNRGYDDAGNPIHFSEFSRPESQAAAHRYDAAIAAAEGPELQKLNLYRLAVDQTMSAPQSAPLTTIDQFQKDYRTFFKLYTDLNKRGKHDEAEARRAEYFGYIKGVRVR